MLTVKKDLEEIKIELKIDTDDDDKAVARAVNSATAYIKNAIGRDKPEFYVDNDDDIIEMLNTALIMMSDHYYTTRSSTIESVTANGTLREYDLGFTSLILQLKALYINYEVKSDD